MRRNAKILAAGSVLLASLFQVSTTDAQDLKAKNATSWETTGRIQFQHLFNSDIDDAASKTKQGFRIRRGRFQVKAKLSDYVSTKFQIEVRDNSPRLKDAEGKLKLGGSGFLRVGQFKVPVWREEFQRSSGKLLLVERSAAAEALADMKLSARHIGLELGAKTSSGLGFAFNYSNGAGEGGREDAGRSKSSSVNNGKLLTGRFSFPVSDKVKIGLSGVASQAGSLIADADNRGATTVLAPDFGLYLPAGDKGRIDIEGGAAFGSLSEDFSGQTEDNGFFLFDLTARWRTKFAKIVESLGGMDAFELAAGYSIVDMDFANKISVLRFGPAFGFGEHARLQINAEIENEDLPNGASESTFKIRSQVTLNF